MAISTTKNKRLINDRLINTSAIPYMRKRSVSYSCKGLRPGAVVDCYFDNKKIITDAVVDLSGNLAGSFTIPVKTPTGKKLFEVYDVDESTSASAEYTAKGVIQTRSRTVTAVRTPPIRIVARPIRRPRFRRWADPLAQSFLVDSAGGAFVTSLDIFFRAKDSTLPVTLYIAEMENGTPTSNIIPFSTVVKEASDVTSNGADPDLALTTFTFSDPIFLEDQTEYAFVLMSDSSKYECWISTLGNIDLKTSQAIAKQPYLGSMFKSQNSTTWTADQLSDIRFTMRKAQFESVSAGAFNIVNQTQKTFNMFDVNIGDITLPETTLDYTYSLDSDLNIPFDNGLGAKFSTNKSVDVASDRLAIRGTMKTSNENISPVIDLERMGTVTVLNKLNSDKINGSQHACGVYISQDVDLLNPAETVRVLVNAKIPAGASIKVFFKTQSTKRAYLTLDTAAAMGVTIDESLIDKTLGVYRQDNSAASVISKLGEIVISGYDSTKIYFKSATDSSMFSNSADAADIHFLSEDLTLDGVTIIQTYNGAESIGDYVLMTGTKKVFKSINAAGSTQPSVSNPDWEVVALVSFDDSLASQVETDSVTWRDMSPTDAIVNSDKYIEYKYKPVLQPESEFLSFAVKIENYVDPLNAGNNPEITDVRAIAAY